jgi:hypothetical protein
MDKYLQAVIAVLLLAAFATAGFKAFQKRTKSQEQEFSEPDEFLPGVVEPELETEGFYVATTYANDKLNRITAYGLGFRGRALFISSPEGLQIHRDGERSIAIPQTRIVRVATDQATIDRVVEANGLIRIDWIADEAELSTFIRIVDDPKRVFFYNQLNNYAK